GAWSLAVSAISYSSCGAASEGPVVHRVRRPVPSPIFGLQADDTTLWVASARPLPWATSEYERHRTDTGIAGPRGVRVARPNAVLEQSGLTTTGPNRGPSPFIWRGLSRLGGAFGLRILCQRKQPLVDLAVIDRDALLDADPDDRLAIEPDLLREL